MESLLAALIPLGLGVLLSPEILMLGLWLGSCQEQALKKAWLFCVAGLFGLAICVAIGFFLSQATSTGPSVVKFTIRAAFGAIFVLLGLHMLIKGHKKIDPSRFSAGVRPIWSAGLGYASTGLNLKVISLATAAGHQVGISVLGPLDRAAGIAVFLGLGFIPLLLPAALESVKHGLVHTIMEPCNRFFMRYGRWLAVMIFFAMAAMMLKGAFEVKPW